MQVILINPRGGKTKVYAFRQRVMIYFSFVLLVAAGIFGFGAHYGSFAQRQLALMDARVHREQLKAQQVRMGESQQKSENRLNALALRLGQLQSQMLRVNAVGQRVVEKLDIGSGEFDFSQLPSMGGIETGNQQYSQQYDELISQVTTLSGQIQNRELQLNALERLRADREIRKESYPAGRPIANGWLSSPYGWRNDPFHGRRSFHHGVDFAGRRGSNVVAVASGLVLSAGNNGGYGKLVTVDHGNGYVTHYGHNSEVMVAVGDRVNQGDVIARMGTTGRSTGPHVHFEVYRKGRRVNPFKFVRTRR